MVKLVLADIQELASVGGYDGTYELSDQTAVTILSAAVWLQDTKNWQGENYDLTQDEIDEIEELVARLEYQIMAAIEPSETTMYTFDARLTLATGNPTPVGSFVEQTTLYLTPYCGNNISLYNGSTAWATHELTEISLEADTLDSLTVYDIFVYDDSGLEIEAVSWTDHNTRANEIVLQDGIWVKSGATTKRYVGTVKTDTNTKFNMVLDNDGGSRKVVIGVWNFYNRIKIPFRIWEDTNTWVYAVATWRPWNNNTDNSVEWLQGVTGDFVDMLAQSWLYCAYAGASFGVVINATSGIPEAMASAWVGQVQTATVNIRKQTDVIGVNTMQLMEYSNGGSVTFGGDQDAPDWHGVGTYGSVSY